MYVRGLKLPDVHDSHEYSNDEIDKAKQSSTRPFDYECGGLPTDMTTEKNDVIVILSELDAQRNILWKKPITHQAKYADAICRAKTADADWCEEQQKSLSEFCNDRFYNVSECILGNLAYSALYSPKEAQRLKALGKWEEYIEWRRKNSDWWIFLMKKKGINLVVCVKGILLCALMIAAIFY